MIPFADIIHLSYLDIFLLTLYWIHLGIFYSLPAQFSFVPRSICDRPWRARALAVASCLGPLLGRVIESRVLITSEQQVAIISSQFIKFSARNCVEIEHNWPKSMRFSCLASCGAVSSSRSLNFSCHFSLKLSIFSFLARLLRLRHWPCPMLGSGIMSRSRYFFAFW